MTIYAKLTDILGTQTSRLASLVPAVINPQFLTDDELTARGVARVEVTRPTVEWWQTYGEPVIDTTVRPVTVTYPVEDLPLADVKTRAAQRMIAERDVRQGGIMTYTFPGDITHTVEMTEKVRSDIAALTTAANSMLIAQIPGTLPFTDLEDTTHNLTPAEVIGFGLATMQWHATIHVTAKTLQGYITASETVEAAIAVQWPES